ncbi:hypothetical protein GCM10007962_32820 [Yeosuana aromativorans]|uniref:Uncharacterized protein n=1 Tax=Yeosuana aromativorans TaxID=288019 RepID=A0A8J3BSG7_9FLAO|nr:hypothetical protein GCM10007962_32820 [Yeosuana aromativorans]
MAENPRGFIRNETIAKPVVHNAEKTELHINFRSDFNQYFVQKRKEK